MSASPSQPGQRVPPVLPGPVRTRLAGGLAWAPLTAAVLQLPWLAIVASVAFTDTGMPAGGMPAWASTARNFVPAWIGLVLGAIAFRGTGRPPRLRAALWCAGMLGCAFWVLPVLLRGGWK